jgi:CTP synthase (UTP-ammonia lyase)
MSTIQNKPAIFTQINEDQVVNCVDLVWIPQIPNILNDRLGQHKKCPGGKEMSLL